MVRETLDHELAGDLEGPNAVITYGDWYVKYPLTHDSEQFQVFLKDDAKLGHIIETWAPADLATIRRSLTESVQARIIAGDWAQPSNDINPKFVKLIPFGSKENVEMFGVDAAVLHGFPGINPTLEQASGGTSALSLVYVMMRSPVRMEDVGKYPLYARAFAQSSQHQRDERDPEYRADA